MGRNKALLPLGGTTMIDHIAGLVLAAAGNVTLIGTPERYGGLGYRTIPDEVENCGPLAGVLTALRATESDWNLIVACDMPNLTAGFLENLFRLAEGSQASAVVPSSATGADPLCAVYHRRCASAAASAIDRKMLKMHDFISTLPVLYCSISDPRPLANINTPEEWSAR